MTSLVMCRDDVMEQAMTKHDNVRGEHVRNPKCLRASPRVTLGLVW